MADNYTVDESARKQMGTCQALPYWPGPHCTLPAGHGRVREGSSIHRAGSLRWGYSASGVATVWDVAESAPAES